MQDLQPSLACGAQRATEGGVGVTSAAWLPPLAFSTFHLLVLAVTPVDLLLALVLVTGSALAGLVFFPRNLIVFLMCLEVATVAVASSFVVVSLIYGGSSGLVFGYFLLVAAGAESALALAVLTGYFFVEHHIQAELASRLKG